jgi:hypothetical protein
MSAKYIARDTTTNQSSEDDDLMLSLFKDGFDYSTAELSGSSCDSNDRHLYDRLVVVGRLCVVQSISTDVLFDMAQYSTQRLFLYCARP